MAYGTTSWGGGSGAAVAGPPPTSTTDVAGAATRAMRTAVGGASVAPSNDLWANRAALTGLAGTLNFIVESATVEAGEPALAVGTGTGTVWWTWSPAFTGLATITVPAGLVVDVYQDMDGTLADAVSIAGSPANRATVTFDVRAGTTYAVRAYATNPADTGEHTLTWSTGPSTLDLTLSDTNPEWAPGFITAYLANDVPGSTVSISFDGGAVAQTVTADSEGNVSFPLELLATLALGSHTVQAVSSSGNVGSTMFALADAEAGFLDPTPPTPSPLVAAPEQRWQLQDPVTGEVWTFPTNPMAQGAAVLPRILNPSWTVAHDGQPIIFEGGRRARAWQLTGHVLTLADKEALQGWQRPYRVYITDDFGRAYIVKIHRVSTQPVRDLLRPEHHTYSLTAYLFGVAT